MQSNVKIQKMCVAALLCAIGILVPMFSPIKIQIPPMSFTLASHVALFIAMFLSPAISLAVWLGTTIGFLLAGFPMMVVLRAASQIVFVMMGAYWLKAHPHVLNNNFGIFTYGVVTGIVHGLAEALVVTWFYFSGVAMDGTFLSTVVGLVGVGTLVHSMFDFVLALMVYKAIAKTLKIPASYIPA